MSIPWPGKPTVPTRRNQVHILGLSLVIRSTWHTRLGRKSLLLRRIWYRRIFRYFSFHLSFSLLAKIYNLLTIKPNLLFVRMNLISLKLLTVGQSRKYFRLLRSGGDNLNLIWQGNRHLHLTRTMWTTLFVKHTTLARRNGPNFVRPAETPSGRYVLCHFNCFPLKIQFL